VSCRTRVQPASTSTPAVARARSKDPFGTSEISGVRRSRRPDRASHHVLVTGVLLEISQRFWTRSGRRAPNVDDRTVPVRRSAGRRYAPQSARNQSRSRRDTRRVESKQHHDQNDRLADDHRRRELAVVEEVLFERSACVHKRAASEQCGRRNLFAARTRAQTREGARRRWGLYGGGGRRGLLDGAVSGGGGGSAFVPADLGTMRLASLTTAPTYRSRRFPGSWHGRSNVPDTCDHHSFRAQAVSGVQAGSTEADRLTDPPQRPSMADPSRSEAAEEVVCVISTCDQDR
jgi:hypothetical protein